MQRCRLASDNKHGQRDLFVDVLVNNTAGSLLQMLVPPQSSCGGYVPAVLAPDPLAVMLADAGALAPAAVMLQKSPSGERGHELLLGAGSG